MKRTLLMLFIAIAPWSVHALDEEVCKSAQLKNPAPTLAEVYAMALASAKAWKGDVVPERVSNTSLGPLQPNGSAADWNLMFYSAAAKASVTIGTMRGTYRCWAAAGSPGRIPDLKADFLRDGAKLYAIAKQHGDALISQGYQVMIGTAAAPDTRHATWNISYSKDYRNANILLIVDANTGAVEKVLKD
jgi:hypothetical protein